MNLISVLSLAMGPISKLKVFTDLYVKHTDHHQYLHFLSAHPYHTKNSVAFSQTLQISRL